MAEAFRVRFHPEGPKQNAQGKPDHDDSDPEKHEAGPGIVEGPQIQLVSAPADSQAYGHPED